MLRLEADGRGFARHAGVIVAEPAHMPVQGRDGEQPGRELAVTVGRVDAVLLDQLERSRGREVPAFPVRGALLHCGDDLAPALDLGITGDTRVPAVGAVRVARTMIAAQRALHVPLEARDGAEEEVARFLQGARSAVEREPGTLSWYALRLGKTRFAILDTFADEAGREAHLSGEVGTALSGSAAPLFAEPPQIHRAQILAFKIASAGGEQRTSVDASAAPVA